MPRKAGGKSTPKTPAGFKHTEDAQGVSSFVYEKNGLQVLVMPRTDVPVVGVQVTYRVGSRHELIGHTGATHILEHLMFKGSSHFDPKNGNGIWHLLEKRGAQMNATTWCDRTNYYAVVPTALFEDVVAIEADRMRNILLRKEDLDSEMTVVRNEYERGENDPRERLTKQAWYQAFTLHPYRIPTIGTKEDIENITVEKLRKFYDTFYWPNNATVLIVGNVTIAEALTMVKKHFGAFPQSEIVEPPYAIEPTQEGERRFELKRTGTVNALLLSFKGPSGLAEDSAATYALKSILADGKSSLLYKALIDTGLAVDVEADFPRFRDASLVEFYVALAGGISADTVEKAIYDAIEKLQKNGPDAEELTRAVTFVNAQRAYYMSSVSGVLGSVNEAIARGNWKDAFKFRDDLKKVTATEVQEVARKYLNKDSVVKGTLHAV